MLTFGGPPAVTQRPYLFIDGDYLRRRVNWIAEEYFDKETFPLDYRQLAGAFEKTFFYDCLPIRGNNEPQEQYEQRKATAQAFHNCLRALPGYHVFLGEIVGSGGSARQKGVDIQIAVHMLTHAFRGHMRKATLLTGDRDFEPLVTALVQEGVYVTVAYHPRSVSNDLLNAADAREVYDTFRLMNLVQPAYRKEYPPPKRMINNGEQFPSLGTSRPIKRGDAGYREILLAQSPDGIYEFFVSQRDAYDNKSYCRTSHENAELIERLLQEEGIAIRWLH